MSKSMMSISMMNTTHYEAEYHEPLNMSLISNIMTKMSLDMIMRNMRMMKMNMWTYSNLIAKKLSINQT